MGVNMNWFPRIEWVSWVGPLELGSIRWHLAGGRPWWVRWAGGQVGRWAGGVAASRRPWGEPYYRVVWYVMEK